MHACVNACVHACVCLCLCVCVWTVHIQVSIFIWMQGFNGEFLGSFMFLRFPAGATKMPLGLIMCLLSAATPCILRRSQLPNCWGSCISESIMEAPIFIVITAHGFRAPGAKWALSTNDDHCGRERQKMDPNALCFAKQPSQELSLKCYRSTV